MGLVLAVTPMSTCSSIVLCVIVTGHGACIVVGFVAARHKKVNRSGSEVSSLWKLETAVLCFVFCVLWCNRPKSLKKIQIFQPQIQKD